MEVTGVWDAKGRSAKLYAVLSLSLESIKSFQFYRKPFIKTRKLSGYNILRQPQEKTKTEKNDRNDKVTRAGYIYRRI